MKVIDLLNKIANGEEVPTFRYEGNRYLYSKATAMFDDLDNDERCKSEIYLSELNDEIEIIEDTPKVQVEMTQQEYNEYLDRKLFTPKEDKKIEKLDDYIAFCDGTYETRWSGTEMYIVDKLNEIIDRLNGKDNDSE